MSPFGCAGYFVVKECKGEISPQLKLLRFCDFFKRHFDNEQPENSISRLLCMNFVVAVPAVAHNKHREREKEKVSRILVWDKL